MNLNREIKAYCPDFAPVRQQLQELGATFVEVKEQIDYYFRLQVPEDNRVTPRLKLRVEGESRELIYYRDHHEAGSRVSEFQIWSNPDPQLLDVLETAFGIRVIVRKQRELWLNDNVRYNLDTVESVGQIFEVEIQNKDDRDIETQLEENRRLFAPCLGPSITSSNEDLVRASARQ